MSWKLKRLHQCKGCPWKVGADPHGEIPGYCEDKHRALANTIAEPAALPFGGELHVFVCHELEDAHCVGWLANQLGEGNNIGLRLAMRDCDNAHLIKLDGEQHARFEDTLP